MKLFIIGLFLMSSSIFAGDEVGNGGNAVICGDKIFSLDLYEAQIYERKLKLKNELSIDGNLDIIFESIESFDPELSQSFKNNLKELKEKVLYYKKPLPIIDDSLHLSVEDQGCKVEQAAVNLQRPLFNRYKYIIQESLFLKMDNINRTGLILHEIIYDEILKKTGQTNSVKTRFFTGILAAENFDLLSPFEYHVLRDYIFKN